MLLLGLSQNLFLNIKDLLGELGSDTQSGSSSTCYASYGGNSKVKDDYVDIQDVLGLLSSWIEDSNTINENESDDNQHSVDADSPHDATDSAHVFVDSLPSPVDFCIVGFVIYLVHLVTTYCGADNRKQQSRPEVYVPGPNSPTVSSCWKGRHQSWVVAGFRKALRKWRQDSGSMQCQ